MDYIILDLQGYDLAYFQTIFRERYNFGFLLAFLRTFNPGPSSLKFFDSFWNDNIIENLLGTLKFFKVKKVKIF